MFPYAGSKSKLVHLYPRPTHRALIEPFAGSARYACRYYNRDVWINDAYPVVFRIWKWIQQASPSDVRGLPVLKTGESLDDPKFKRLSDDERLLMGFAVNRGGTSTPCKTCIKWCGEKNGVHFQRFKDALLKLVGRIGHWQITNQQWRHVQFDGPATWFIDPPYEGHPSSKRYGSKRPINYDNLSKWCLAKQGQIIVCESSPAAWLPFRVLRHCNRGDETTRKETYAELVYTRNDRPIGFGFNATSPAKATRK